MTLVSAPLPPVLDPATVLRTRLANGLTVLVRRDASAPVAAVVTYVKAGYFDETDDVAGISHVLEHMFFKGTPTRGVGEIARQTKASGGYLNAHTSYDHTTYYAVLPSSGFAAGLEVQADAYANSLIDAGELRKELEVIIQEAKRKADNPHAVAVETLYEVLHDRHRMRRWRIGHEPGLRALTRDALLAFYRNFYRPSNTILAIVGDVDVERTLADVERLYGALPDGAVVRTPGPAEPEHADFRYREWTGDIAQTQLAAGWRTPGLLHPDTPLLDVVGAVLGSGRASRLYRAVRERKLAAAITAYDYTPDGVGVFVLHAETPVDTAVEAARATWAQLRNLLDEGVGDQEVERARRLFEARWLRRLETMEGQANYLAEWEAAGDWRLGERYLERLLSATASTVGEVARRYLTPDRAGLVVYRPAGAPRFAADGDAARARLRDAPALPLAPTPARQAAASARGSAPTLECREAGVHVYRTADGLPLLVWPKPGATITYAGVFVAGGAGEEPRPEAGLTKLLTRTALKGTERRTATQIAEDAELVGASLGGSVSADSFGWSVSVPAPHTIAALDLLADVVQHATIPEEAFETERTIALADVAALRDDMYRQPMRLLLDAAYDGHPYGTPSSGDETSLAALTADAVRAWHERRVRGGRVVVGLVGDGDPDELAALAARHFAALREGEWAPGVPPVWPAAGAQRVEPRDKAQTALALAFPGPGRRDPARFAAELLAGVASGLGGRFFEELRDRQSLAYTVHAHASERVLGGLFSAYIATSPEQEERARVGLLGEFARLREQPVTADELQRAKTYALGTHAIARERGGSRLGEMVDVWLAGTGLAELAEYETRIAAVTVEDVQALAARYFDPAWRVEGVVRGTGRKV
ncbi:MAG TPA: pitrilysin family protein [Gemmatimonadaceae bacterium]|nr:pitrilysin family protein [Gemmatimonadaceae bacterium]